MAFFRSSLRVDGGHVVDSRSCFGKFHISLLLATESLSLGTRFSFQGSLHRVHGALVIFAGVVKLFFLLMDLSVNLLADLSKLKLSSKNLVLFLLKSSFSFFKSSLKFFLFNFETTTLFVELVNGSSSISQLVKKVLDLISKILVFSLYNIKLFHGFIPGCLETEELAVVVSAFLLAGINFCSDVIGLCLPFTDNLVKVLATSFGDDCSSVDTLVFKLKVFEFSLKTVLSLFGAGNLLVEGVNGFFSLIQTSAKFLSSSFQFFDMSQSLGFVFGSPQLHFSGGLGQSFKGIRFLLVFFIDLLLQVFKLSSHVLEFAEKGCTISSFAISKSLGIFQLGGKRDF